MHIDKNIRSGESKKARYCLRIRPMVQVAQACNMTLYILPIIPVTLAFPLHLRPRHSVSLHAIPTPTTVCKIQAKQVVIGGCGCMRAK
eukprot:6179951-Pleurochrysis_carterae.AAC.2